MMNRFETYFDAFYVNFTTVKTLGQFQNLGFAIMSTRENICLIARTPCAISIGMPLNLIDHYKFSNFHERIAITYKKAQ